MRAAFSWAMRSTTRIASASLHSSSVDEAAQHPVNAVAPQGRTEEMQLGGTEAV